MWSVNLVFVKKKKKKKREKYEKPLNYQQLQLWVWDEIYFDLE